MADTFTPNFDFVLPEIGGSPDTWGNKLNENFSRLDDLVVPSGLIAMWSGAVGAVPEGWALCDGTSGTPDLRGRFIVGAGGSYGVGDTGGANDVTLSSDQIPAHSHSASTGSSGNHSHSGSANSAGSHSHSGSADSAGAHSHSISGRGKDGDSSTTPDLQGRGEDRSVGAGSAIGSGGVHTHSLSINSNGSHSHSLSIDSNGAHTHSVSVANTGGGQSHENRPPYYALAYIMKI